MPRQPASRGPRAARASRVSRAADDGIVGASPAIRHLRRLIERVAPTDATVLIVGERGTGKELVAGAIQRRSRRRDRAFVTVNCAALPTELLASELFGHERGAFTGAVTRAAGLVAAADGGTLFLDEVGDLPLPAQAMLLRFLQEGEVRPIGSARTFRVDVRIIAATNRDLEADIAAQRFRPDLRDRLAEITLAVPPLRDRRDDIPALVDHFLAAQATRHGVRRPALGEEARRTLHLYDWPGNVRELEQAISRAVIFAGPAPVTPLDMGLPGLSTTGLDRGQRDDESDGARHWRTRVREGALALARRGKGVQRRDLVARFGVSGEAVRRELVALVNAGLLIRVERYRGTRYVPASRREKGQEALPKGYPRGVSP